MNFIHYNGEQPGPPGKRGRGSIHTINITCPSRRESSSLFQVLGPAGDLLSLLVGRAVGEDDINRTHMDVDS